MSGDSWTGELMWMEQVRLEQANLEQARLEQARLEQEHLEHDRLDRAHQLRKRLEQERQEQHDEVLQHRKQESQSHVPGSKDNESDSGKEQTQKRYTQQNTQSLMARGVEADQIDGFVKQVTSNLMITTHC